MTESEASTNTDPVSQAIQEANRLLDSSPSRADIAALIDDIVALSPRDLARFDCQARSWTSGVKWPAVKRLRWPPLHGPRKTLWHTLALVSSDGFERERAIKAAPPTPLHIQLIVIRCLDWVDQVRDAALTWFDAVADDQLVDALPLAEHLAVERSRGGILNALLEGRLSDDHLRLAGHSSVAIVRRSAWRRLGDRDVLTETDLDRMLNDSDVLVRAVVARLVPTLDPVVQRRCAERLVADHVGWIATPALAVLVGLDGDGAIMLALTARTAPVRRAAQDWARLRDVDARSVYARRFDADPADPIALLGLAEIGNPADIEIFEAMVVEGRARIVASGIRALARVDDRRGRNAAVAALVNRPAGRVTWAAASVLRGTTPNEAEAAALVAVAVDPERSAGQRFRALSLLRPLRWRHLVVLLDIRARETVPSVRRRLDMELDAWLDLSGRIRRRPTGEAANSLRAFLATLDARRRERIEFILRTTTD